MPEFFGPGGLGDEFFAQLSNNPHFNALIEKRFGPLAKADTISQSTNLLRYDLAPYVQQLYPYKQLTPMISRLPRVSMNGGNAFHWKRITGINVTNVSAVVSEGNRGARIALAEQDATAVVRTLGLESSVTFEARFGAVGLTPDAIGMAVLATLRDLRIQEEQFLMNGNASLPLGPTPTPTLVAGTAPTGYTGTFAGATYVACVALSGFGYTGYSPYNSTTTTGGVPGRITKTNADGTTDTFGGGSATPSAIATVTPTGTQCITASVTAVTGAAAYAWFVGASNSTSAMYFAGMTPSNQVILTAVPAATNQPLSNLYVGGVGVDNSTNTLGPDGILPQIFGAITSAAPGTWMSTNPLSPSGITYSNSGSVIYSLATGNTGVTISGNTIDEFDAVFRAAWEQYKIGYDRIIMSATDMMDTFGTMLDQASSGTIFRMLFEQQSGKIVAGHKVTSYMNKMTNQTLDVEVHPYLPPGIIIFWSDRSPYANSGVANLIEARVRQDYYQIEWPWSTRRYESGVYVDECFPMYFSPAFGAIINKNTSGGSLVY